jgi:hypothetical protein
MKQHYLGASLACQQVHLRGFKEAPCHLMLQMDALCGEFLRLDCARNTASATCIVSCTGLGLPGAAAA